MSLVDKVALVTGASSGIGAAIAVKLTKEGAKVAIVGRNRTKLNNVSEICEKHGHKPLIITADVSDNDDAKKIISATLNCFMKIDILINNAGIGGSCSILYENAMEIYDKVLATNLRAPVYLTHLAGKHLIKTKGNIVNISSVASQGMFAQTAFYSTSKAGLDHFTRCVAYELGPQGVRVNVVNPGPVRTDIIENMGVSKIEADNLWETMEKASLLDRISEPEEIADLVAFLVSEKGRSISGSAIVTDNGALLKGPTP